MAEQGPIGAALGPCGCNSVWPTTLLKYCTYYICHSLLLIDCIYCKDLSFLYCNKCSLRLKIFAGLAVEIVRGI